MKRAPFVVIFTTLCLLLVNPPLAGAQGINPITPPTNWLIQVIPPIQANPSNFYATQAFFGTLTQGYAVSGCTALGVVFNSGGTIGCDGGLTKAAGATGTVTVGGTLSGVAAIFTSSVTGEAFIANGTPPTLTGSCSVVAGTQKGGNTVGEFAVPAGACATTTTVILTFALTAPTGYACDAHDVTTPTSIWDQTGVANETTTATFTIRSVGGSAADVIKFKCIAY